MCQSMCSHERHTVKCSATAWKFGQVQGARTRVVCALAYVLSWAIATIAQAMRAVKAVACLSNVYRLAVLNI